uniref:Uncharacterized protein n=1 Tax=Avena sativa TaxID=4498 RepID=A0ACD5VYX5_AVESA
MASKQGSSAAKAVAADCDPLYEWVDGDGSYLLRLTLPGFKKEDFRVHVDPAGRLTIIGHRPTDGGAGSVRLHKVFQLPSTSDLDGITGRYDGSALRLTVPKLPSIAVPVPPPEAPKEQDKEAPSDVSDKPTDKRVGREAERLIEAARARLQGRHKEEAAKEQTATSSNKSPATKVDGRKEVPKPEATQRRAEKILTKREDDHGEKAKAAEHKAKLERAAEGDPERDTGSWNWKERATEEGIKLAEVIGNNKEVIATAVAAFTLGVFLSHRLFSRS